MRVAPRLLLIVPLLIQGCSWNMLSKSGEVELTAFSVSGVQDARVWEQLPVDEVVAGEDRSLSLRTRMTTGYACYSFRPGTASRTGSNILLRIDSQSSSQACLAVVGMWSVEATLGALDPGHYRVRVVHVADGRRPGELILDSSVVIE
jgi:hypothetical protein